MTTPICDFGQKAIDFSLRSVDGEVYDLASCRGAKATLIMFLCNHCPYVQAIIGRLVDDMQSLALLDVKAVAIMSNDTVAYPADSFPNMVAFAQKHKLPFPYLMDKDQSIAKSYQAVCTPDFFGYNQDLKLQYRGCFDDRGGPDGKAHTRLLYQAMEQIATTGAGPLEQRPSTGCSVKWRV